MAASIHLEKYVTLAILAMLLIETETVSSVSQHQSLIWDATHSRMGNASNVLLVITLIGIEFVE